MSLRARPSAKSTAILLLCMMITMPAGPSEASTPLPTHVHIQGFSFTPSGTTITAGAEVQWDNHDGASHTVTADGGAFQSDVLAPGATYTRSFPTPGTYTYHCAIHTSMRGTITVDAPNEAPTISITTPVPGATLSNTTLITGTAADADGAVARVEVSVNGGAYATARGTDTWEIAIDTYDHPNGHATIHARAFDGTAYSAILEVPVTIANAPRPDLTIDADGITIMTQTLTDTTYAITIRNAGTRPAPATQTELSYTYGETTRVIARVTTPPLAPGAQTIIQVTWDTTGKIGTFDVTATADALHGIEETRETNNTATRTTRIVLDTPGIALTNP